MDVIILAALLALHKTKYTLPLIDQAYILKLRHYSRKLQESNAAPSQRLVVYANVWPFCEKIESASGAACVHRMHIQSSLRSSSLLAPTTLCALCFAFRATFTCYFIELRGATLFVPLLLLFASGVAVVTAPPALVSQRKSDYGSKSFCTHTQTPARLLS